MSPAAALTLGLPLQHHRRAAVPGSASRAQPQPRGLPRAGAPAGPRDARGLRGGVRDGAADRRRTDTSGGGTRQVRSRVAGPRSNVRTQSFAIRTRVTLIEAAWLPPRTADIPVGFVLLGAHGGAPLRLDRGLTARLRIHAAHDVGHRLNCIPEPTVHRRPWAGAASGPIPEILPPSKAPRTADRGCEPPADRSPHPPPR